MIRYSDCIVIGHAALDHVYRVERLPVSATKVRSLEHIDAGGGMAANSAAAIARLGGRVELWSRVGGDPAGHAIRQALDEVGVDTQYVRTFENARSSTAAVIVDAHGERLVVSERDHAMPMDPAWLPLDRIRHATVVFSDLSWKEATIAAFKVARSHAVATLLDVDIGAGVLPTDILECTDYSVFSFDGLTAFSTGETVEDRLAWAQSFGLRHVGVTHGGEGYRWREADGRVYHQPAFETRAIDTTGAGDAFHGAFAWALSQGLEIAQCTRLATAAAALKCRRLGARAGLARLEEVRSFLAERGDVELAEVLERLIAK